MNSLEIVSSTSRNAVLNAALSRNAPKGIQFKHIQKPQQKGRTLTRAALAILDVEPCDEFLKTLNTNMIMVPMMKWFTKNAGSRLIKQSLEEVKLSKNQVFKTIGKASYEEMSGAALKIGVNPAELCEWADNVNGMGEKEIATEICEMISRGMTQEYKVMNQLKHEVSKHVAAGKIEEIVKMRDWKNVVESESDETKVMIEIYSEVNTAVKIDEAIDYLERVQYTRHMCDQKTHDAIDERLAKFVNYDEYMLCKMVYPQLKGMEMEKTIKTIEKVAENIEARELLSLIDGIKTMDELQVLKENYTSIKMRMVIDEKKKRLMVQSKLDAVRFLQNVRVATQDDEVLRRFNDWYNAKVQKGKEVNADDMRARLTSIKKGREDEIKNEIATRTMIGWANTIELLDSLHTSVAGDEILQRMFDFKRKVLIEKQKSGSEKGDGYESEGTHDESEQETEDDGNSETVNEEKKKQEFDETGQVIIEHKKVLKKNSEASSEEKGVPQVAYDEDGVPYMDKQKQKQKVETNGNGKRITQEEIERDMKERERIGQLMANGNAASSTLSIGTIDTQV